MEIAWSPDGKMVAASEQMERAKTDKSKPDPLATGSITLLAADGQHRQVLIESGGQHPTWSPDGAMVAFLSARSGVAEIWLINADGSDLRQLTFTGKEHELVPSYAPVWVSGQE